MIEYISHQERQRRALAAARAFTAIVMIGFAAVAQAQSSSGGVGTTQSFISGFGCTLYKFFIGELAIWTFIGVVAATLLIGIIAKVDFAKLISVVVIFGILQGLGAFFANYAKIGSALQGCAA